MKKIRLDKILSSSGFGSRKDVKALIKAGSIHIEDQLVSDPSVLVDPDLQRILVHGEHLDYREFYYLMMNKPADTISATKDPKETTVLDLLPPTLRARDLFPVGRLDKDSEGLLLLSNDGPLAHRLLSPKKHVPKTYFAEIDGHVTQEDVETFKMGIQLEENFTTLPADLVILSAEHVSTIHVTIYEGKYHQVKRMFEAVGKRVKYLKRISMGSLVLDEAIPPGGYRDLTAEEVADLGGHG